MALNYSNRYPGRFNVPDADYPQGSFKNRSAPGAKDGSYLERDWANDKEGFFQALLKNSGITPNGGVDTAISSQYYSALATSLAGKLDVVKALGQTQKWQSVSRTAGVTYTNTTGRPIVLHCTLESSSASVSSSVSVDGVLIEIASCQSQLGPSRASGSIIIPAWVAYTIHELNVVTKYYAELR